MVCSYVQVLAEGVPVGRRAAIVGAGGIGFDVAEFITHSGDDTSLDRNAFLSAWGIDRNYRAAGGLAAGGPDQPAPNRQVYMLQRKDAKIGKDLGKTTGWIHRSTLTKRGVSMINRVAYQKIDDQGVHIVRDGKLQVLGADTVIICAGQQSQNALYHALANVTARVHLIGGAEQAFELDAKRAIDQGCRLAAAL
jgi:2,4-dienoyl-CoA reductase (NADPH2)